MAMPVAPGVLYLITDIVRFGRSPFVDAALCAGRQPAETQISAVGFRSGSTFLTVRFSHTNMQPAVMFWSSALLLFEVMCL